MAGDTWLDGPWTVACPSCYAKVDEPCYGSTSARSRRSMVSGYHPARVTAWGAARDRARAIRAEVKRAGNAL